MRKKVLTLDAVIAKEIEYSIENNELSEGDRLPSERKLAEFYNVQRGTIRNALGILRDKGMLITREKSGNYVAPRRIDFNLDAYNSRKTAIELMGISTSVKLLTFDKIYCNKQMSEETGWPIDCQVFRIMRLRYAGGVPMGLERTHVKCEYAPKLEEGDVNNKSLYAALASKHNVNMKRAESKVTAAFANGLESELLNIKVSRPVMRYEGLVYDQEERLIEYFDDIIIKEYVQFISNDR